MLIKKPSDMRYSEVTPKYLYMNRRNFLAGAAAAAGAAALMGRSAGDWLEPRSVQAGGAKLENLVKSPFSTTEKYTSYDAITNYNNYYEFSTNKDDPAVKAQELRDQSVDGERGRRSVQAGEISILLRS